MRIALTAEGDRLTVTPLSSQYNDIHTYSSAPDTIDAKHTWATSHGTI